MRGIISNSEPLAAISPAALSAYARSEGWQKTEEYGEHSDVYAADNRPEVIVPRTTQLGDYPEVVSRLISIFAEVAGADDLALYRDLVTADRDVIRFRAAASKDGSIPINRGLDLVEGARNMVLAAACSLREPRRLYRAGANKEASDYLDRVRLGQTEQGSFTITLLTPVIPPPTQPALDSVGEAEDEPIERRVTSRLAEALHAVRKATEDANSGATNAFYFTVDSGVSANLCEALVQLIQPFPDTDITTVWARTRPAPRRREVSRFSQGDAPILREAARFFRSREPRLDIELFGFVQRLKREESETDGTITLRASIEGKTESVTAVLSQHDYETAVLAHGSRAPVIAVGDLERVGQRWHLQSPRIKEIIQGEEADGA